MRLLSICLLAIFGILAAASIINIQSDYSKRSLSAPIKRDSSVSLERRKGGGGGGRSSGGSSSSGSSSSGGSSSGASSGGRTSSGSAGAAGTSNRGGTSVGGSGSPRSYGGGSYYSGGAARPYTAGSRSPRGIAPAALIGVGGLTFFGGLWLYGAYLYPYSRPYGYYNRTANRNESKPVNCLCQQYSVCGCDDNDNSTFLSSVIGDGTNLNSSLVRVADVNGTSQIFLNGTLENGTTADGPDEATASSAAVIRLPPTVNALLFAFAMGSALLAL